MSEANVSRASLSPEALAALLSEERSTPERLAALDELRDQLADEASLNALAARVVGEKTLEVRRAMLGLLLDADITRLHDRSPYIDVMLELVAGEPERELRLLATRRLAELAPDLPELEELLAETLLHERSDAINQAALVGLLRRPGKSPRTHALLFDYARACPPGLRPLLLQLFRQEPREVAERGLLAMLSPWEERSLRGALLAALEELPSLSPEGIRQLVGYLRAEPVRELRAQVARILGALRAGAESLAPVLLKVLAQSPDGAELLDALAHRLDAEPALVPLFSQLLAAPGPRRLKLRLLALLEKARATAPLAQALGDANPWVRFAAIECCARLLGRDAGTLAQALCEAASRETLVELRARIAAALAGVERLSPDRQRFLVEWAAREESPRVSARLAEALPRVALTEETRAPLLAAFLRVVCDPFAAPAARRACAERLRSFAFRDEPVLIACLQELLLRAATREEAAEWDAQLRKLAPDARARIPLLRALLYRYLGDYPAEPTASWLRELHALAPGVDEVRAEIPQWVALTGESWMLGAADAAEKKSALLPLLRELLAAGKTTDAQRRIEEAWGERTLRKSDLIALYQRLLVDIPGEQGVLQAVVNILGQAKLATPEIQELSLAFLRKRPRSDLAYNVARLLEEVAKDALGYGERVMDSFTPEAYAAFRRTGDDPRDIKEVWKTLNDWEYQGFRVAYPDWKLAELFFALSRPADLHALLASPPPADLEAAHTLHALVLQQLWRKPDTETPELLTALGALARNAQREPLLPLRDRALLLVWKKWKGVLKALQGSAPPPALAALASESYLHLLEVRAGFGPESKERLPEPLPEMDLRWLETHWSLSPEAWTELLPLFEKVAEARAKELWQLTAALANKGKRAEAGALAMRLLEGFAQTRLVREKQAEIDSWRAAQGF